MCVHIPAIIIRGLSSIFTMGVVSRVQKEQHIVAIRSSLLFHHATYNSMASEYGKYNT
jgi:hypothetical protein